MMIKDENKSNNKKRTAKAVYIALGLCVLAAGAIGYSASMNLPDVDVKVTLPTAVEYENTYRYFGGEKVTIDMNATEPQITAAPVEQTEPLETEPDAKAVFGNEDEGQTQEENRPPEKYRLPLSSEMGKDYSMGVPVFNSTMGDYRTHNGVDFVGKPGDAVMPIASGKVVAVENDNVKGNFVTVDHGGGVLSTVWGLADEGLIAEGDEVAEDSVIGLLGKIPCEQRDGDHIHLEVRINGKLADPLEVLGLSENTNE